MKIAVIADIHSNVFALESVLTDIKKLSVDLILNLGDILYGPIAPRETWELLMSENIISISGNQDRQIHEADEPEISSNPTLSFILNELGTEPVQWLKSLPFDKSIAPDIYLCHGSPKSDMEYLLENVDKGYPILRKDEEIINSLHGEASKIILCGHSHIFRSVMLRSGQIVINPGSVGLPAYKDEEPVVHVMENFSPFASYAVIEKNHEDWIIDNRKIPYNYTEAADRAAKRNRRDWEYALRTGRAL